MAQEISSVLTDAASKLVKSNSSASAMQNTQSSFTEFLRFMDVETNNLKSIKFDKKKIANLQTVNVSSTFGDTGNLLSSLFSGALDLGGFLGDMVRGRKRGGTPAEAEAPEPIPKGNRIRLSDMRGIGIMSAIFGAVDFAGGLAAGESPGKAASGAAGGVIGGIAGELAGTAIAGAIGQALVPVPGLGFVLGAALGTLGAQVGGNLGSQAYDTLTGEQQTSQNVKQQEVQQKTKSLSALQASSTPADDVMDKFDKVVTKFQNMSEQMYANVTNMAYAMAGSNMRMLDYGLNPNALPEAQPMPGQLQDITATGGKLPSGSVISSPYGWRNGRMHTGIDFAGLPVGTPISVIQPGKVTYAQFNDGGYGNLVEVTHPGGTSTYYAHLNQISVREGQEVTPGTVVGQLGSTGRSTGPHLHFEIRSGGKPTALSAQDADKYFRFGGNVKVKEKSNQAQTQPPPVVTPNQQNKEAPKSTLDSRTPPTSPKSKQDKTVKQVSQLLNAQQNQTVASSQVPPQVTPPPQQNNIPLNSIQPVPNYYSVPNIVQQYQQYPTYIQGQSTLTLMPITMPQNGSQPVIVSSSSGGGGVAIIPGPSEGQVVNALVKTMLLTNLSAT